MIFLNNYENFLKNSVLAIEVFTYTISIIIIGLSIIYSVLNYVKEFHNPTKAFYDTRLILGESVELALSFILCVEILKLFYVKTYKQLVMIVSLCLLKLTITYFLSYEIKTSPPKKTN